MGMNRANLPSIAIALAAGVGLGALVTALVAVPVSGGDSTLQILLDSIQLGYARLVAAISVPV